ncbi:MAG: fibrobacter succinogenes major paralogous domain-containing protein [Fibromonadales bacterium]|nr:fibrobacter succinogenes major paralogous domain-containing protein [Fibromonadales bacterium]
MVLKFFLLAVTLLFISCADFERDNPEDQRSNKYVANQLPSSPSGEISSSSRPSSSSITIYSSSSSVNPIGACPNAVTSSNNTMSCGGQTYKTVKIGDQVWMAENMNYDVEGSKCYDDDPANCVTYGRLYSWRTAMVVCPSGWYLPSDDIDWLKLMQYVENDNGCWSCAGKYLKAKNGWYNNGNGEDKYDFSALPGGRGLSGGSFDFVGSTSYWWTGDENTGGAYYRNMSFNNNIIGYNTFDKSSLQSVRCVKD